MVKVVLSYDQKGSAKFQTQPSINGHEKRIEHTSDGVRLNGSGRRGVCEDGGDSVIGAVGGGSGTEGGGGDDIPFCCGCSTSLRGDASTCCCWVVGDEGDGGGIIIAVTSSCLIT